VEQEPSEGARQLKGFVGPTQSELAAKLGVKQQSLSQWLRGDAKPSAAMRIRLARELHIPVEAWDEAPALADDPPESSSNRGDANAKGAA
jgi:transcriptional regulator with XRE-family HTH domain